MLEATAPDIDYQRMHGVVGLAWRPSDLGFPMSACGNDTRNPDDKVKMRLARPGSHS